MKILKFKTVVSLLAALTLTTAASAEVTVRQDYDGDTISFSGISAVPEDFVNVKIQKGEVPVIVLESRTDKSGGYEFVISPEIETGMYDILVRTYELLDTGSFVYVNDSDADKVFEVLNGEAKNSDVEKMFKDEKQRIVLQGLDYDYTELADKTALYSALIENADYSGDLSKKMQKLRAAGIICSIYESKTNEQAEKIADTYAELLGISELDAYSLDEKEYISDSFSKKLYGQIKNLGVYNLGDFVDEYREKAILCAAKSLKATEYIGELLNDMDEDIEYTKFNKLSKSKRAKIGTELTFSEDYKSVSDMVDAFNEKVEEAYEDNGSGGSGGSGGGGGGRAGGVQQATNVMNIENDEVVKENEGFEDMGSHEWAAEAVEYLRKLGVVNGYDAKTFGPSRNVTREEFVKMIVNAFQISADATNLKFDDVSYDDWYYDSVMNAASAMIINGISDSMFGAGQNITRQDAASIIFRTLNYKGILLDVGDVDFADADEIAEYAYDAVSALKNSGYIKGNDDNTFAPERFLSRAEAAQMVYSAIWKGEK